MKKLFLLVVCLFFLSGISVAQDTLDNVFFGGLRYDEGPFLTIGVGTNLVGNLWNFTYTDFGDYQSLNVELAYVMKFGKFGAGPIAGPNVDWYGTAEGDDVEMISYLVGAAGGLLSYDLGGKSGVAGYYKYKFALEENLYYKNGSVGGIFGYWRF